MATQVRAVRQSVTLPPRVARRVKDLAKSLRSSSNRVIVDLVETGLAARDREREQFMDLADRLTKTTDVEEQAKIKQELARLTFGS